MIKIIGTNHLMSEEAIEGILKDESPDILGIELCELREQALLQEVKQKKAAEEKSLLGKITSSIREKADQEGLDYGTDMKTALHFARENKIPYYLVDMPVIKTQELFSKIPKEEQEGFTKELTEFQQNGNINDEVKSEEVIQGMKERYPIAFEFLVNMRNLYIANQILVAENNNPGKKIVVILGDAHAKQVKKMVKQSG